MNGGLQFNVAGVPVRVLWMFFLVTLLLGSSLGDPVLVAVWIAVVFVSILVHEFGHAAAYVRFGVRPEIVLHGFGGLTFGRSLPPGRDLVVSLAGPAAGLAVGLPLLWVSRQVAISSELVADVVWMAVFVNVFWALLNLLPILPLDGGHALSSLLALVFRRDMTATVQIISMVTAALAIGLAIRYQLIFAALLAGYYLWMNLQAFTARRRGPKGWAPAVTNPPGGTGRSGQAAPPTSGPSLPRLGGPGAARPPIDGQASSPGPAPSWPDAPPSSPPARLPEVPTAAADPTAGAWVSEPLVDPTPGPTTGAAPAPATGATGPDPAAWAPSAPEPVRPRPTAARGERSFAQEVDVAARALAGDEPALAAIAVDRARRLATSDDEHLVVDHLEAEAHRRLAGN